MKMIYLVIAGIFGVCIVPCVLTKSIVLGLLCVITSFTFVLIHDFKTEE